MAAARFKERIVRVETRTVRPSRRIVCKFTFCLRRDAILEWERELAELARLPESMSIRDIELLMRGRIAESGNFVKGRPYERIGDMSLISLLFSEPLVFLVIVGALVLTLSLHEFFHAWVAGLLGDRTAEREGRLTLNPLAHLDPFGFLLILVAGFGYAKPVPYNPYNLKYPVWGPALIAAAGPVSNLLFGIICSVAFGLLATHLDPNNLLLAALWFLGRINFSLMLFNLIPLPPLDGSKALLAALSGPQYARARAWLETQGPLVLLGVILADAVLGLGIFSWISTASDWLFRLMS